MKVTYTDFDGLILIDPLVHVDRRGQFTETWRQSRYAAIGMPQVMRQENLSWSRRGVLRGLHFQNPMAQAKLISVIEGKIFDVVVDLRRGSPTYLQWFGTHLTGANRRQLYVPEGFAHGFCVLSRSALVSYKCSVEYSPGCAHAIRWDDSQLAIDWPIDDPILSKADEDAALLSDVPEKWLPGYSRAAQCTST